jgi:micrococcal nuclease
MTRRRLIWTTFCILFFVLFGFVALKRGWIGPINTTSFMHMEPGSFAIDEFVDGDTIIVDMNGTQEIIRFIGLDTPETHKPNTPVQCFGPDAAAYTKQRIGGQRVRLVADHLTTNRDRYDRLLRYVVLEDGTNLNLELVSKGYAFAYAFPFAKTQEFSTAMERARHAKLGLWGSCQPTQNVTTGQWLSNSLEIQPTP